VGKAYECLAVGGEKEPFQTMPENSVATRVRPYVKVSQSLLAFYQSLTDLREGKYPTPANSSHRAPPKRPDRESEKREVQSSDTGSLKD
jgi:hypothetical protein